MANRIKLNGTTANSFQIGTRGPILSSNNVTSSYQLNLPTGVGNANQVLSTDGTGNLSWVTQTGGSGSPGGSNTQVQFNDNGSFNGSAAFTFNNTSNLVSLSGNLSVGNGITTTDFVNFDTANVGAGQTAQLTWNDGEGTLDLGLKGGNVTLNIGTQEYARCYNAEANTLNKGEVVYVFGSQGNRISVKRAQANVEATSFGTLGFVAESITSGSEGYVITSGALTKLNTNGLTAGSAVYLSPSVAGGYTTTKPVAPDQLVVLGWVERVNTTVGSIYVKVDNGYELDELHDVLITSPVAGQSLVYGASNLWINGNAAYSNTAGTVTANSQPNITSLGTLTNLSVTGNATIGGNLFVNGNLTYLNVETVAIEDPIINLNTGANGTPPSSNSGKDVGTALNYFDTNAKLAFMGWDVSNAEISFGSDVTLNNEVVTFNQLANIRSGNSLTTGVFATTLSATGNARVANITVTNISNLGNVGNVRITGGSNNFVLKTDGSGNLSWTQQTGGDTISPFLLMGA